MAQDTDGDGLTDQAEVFHGTDTNDWDSDGDLFSDSWEIAYEYDAGDGQEPDQEDDDDNDDLSNFDEMRHGTNPKKSDTDGDGVDDGTEVDAGSDPTDADDEGNPTNCVSLALVVGDHSLSHSERYEMLVGMVHHASSEFGQVASNNFGFVIGKEYPFEVRHLGTDPDYTGTPWPDYDYKATIGGLGGDAGWLTGNGFSVHDPEGVLGEHGESEYNFAAGKSGRLCVHGVSLDLEGHDAGRGDENDPLAEAEEESPGVWIVDPGVGEKKAKIVVKALGDTGYERWLTFSDHTKVKLNGSVPSSNPMQVSGDSDTDVSYDVVTNSNWNIVSNVMVSLSVKKDGETLPGVDILQLGPVKVVIEDPGAVVLTGATQNVCFALTADSWTNCTWDISPSIATGGALFATGPAEPGSNSFCTGTSVWVNPGTVVTNYTIRVYPAEPINCEDTAGLAVCREPAWTPMGSNIYVWAPVNDGAFCGGFLDDLSDEYQGWESRTNGVITEFHDPNTNDNDCGDCTLTNLKAMTNGGIVVVLAHGGAGSVEVARFLSEEAADDWRGTETGLLSVPDDETNYWSVVALAAWFQDNWQSALDERQAIVFLAVCCSADGVESIGESVGGRTVFAVSDEQDGSDVDLVYQEIVGHMNGTHGEPRQRKAADAYAAATNVWGPIFPDMIVMEGDGRSTLCPVSSTVFPLHAAEAKAEWGCISFDTYMDDASADEAVVATKGVVGSRTWGTDGIGSYYIDFEFSGKGIGVEAVSDKCRSASTLEQGRPLDGDAQAPMPVGGQSEKWSW